MDPARDPAGRRVVALVLTVPQRLTWWATEGVYAWVWWSPCPYRVVGVTEDGAELAERASVVDLAEGYTGGYFWDQATGRVHVYPYAEDPREVVISARVRFGLATHPRAGGDFPLPLEGRLVGVPELSLRVEAEFGEAAQVGGGDVALANGDGWADALAALDWSAGEATLYYATERVY